MADSDKPCTRNEALGLIKKLRLEVDTAEGQANTAPHIARLRTLSDSDLASLSDEPATFAILESNRRFLAALQKEARRTTWLTILIAVVAILTLIVAGLEVYDEFFRPD